MRAWRSSVELSRAQYRAQWSYAKLIRAQWSYAQLSLMSSTGLATSFSMSLLLSSELSSPASTGLRLSCGASLTGRV